MKIRSSVVFLLLCLVFLLTGCATVDPKPFSEFSLAVQEFRDGADAALSTNYDLNRERYIERIAQQSMQPEGGDDVSGLFVEPVENDPFGWKMDSVPLFMATKRFQHGVYTLNSSMVTYADLLKSLSSPELVSQDQFDEMSRKMDAGLTAAANQLDLKDVDKGVAMFSAAATQAAHAYIDNKRSNELKKIVENNQTLIEALANKLQEAMRLVALNSQADYQNRMTKLAEQLTPDAKGNLGAREKVVVQFVALNEEYVVRLEVLRELHSYCQVLPAAHRELALAINSPKMKLSAINDLANKGKQLNKLYKELAKN